MASAKMIFKMPDFKPALGVVNQLAGDIKLTTTGLEAYGVAASKSTSAGFSGLGLNAKALRSLKSEAASVAFSMNTDIGSVTKSFAALEQAGVDVTRYGFKSKAEYTKFLSITGAESDAMASSLGTMSKRLGMADGDIRDVVESVGAIGQKFKMTKEAYAGMGPVVQGVTEQFERFPEAWPADRQKDFIKGTVAVAGALVSLGAPAAGAMESANKLGAVLLQGEQGMGKLYSGLANKLPGGMEVLTRHLGEIGPAFDMLKSSPDQFMLKMGEMVKEVRNSPKFVESDLIMFKDQMADTFGPEVLRAFTEEGFDKIGPSLKDAAKPMKGQDKIIGELASAYEDGRTMAERFAIAQDRVQTKLKQVKGVMSDSEYLTKYNEQSKDYLKTVNRLAGRGGALGKLTTSLIEVKNRGLGGFLSAHSEFGFAMSEGLKLVQPMLQYLPALKVAFMALSSPIALVAGAVAGLFFLFKDLGKGTNSVVRPMLDKLMAEAPAFLSKIWDVMQEVFATVWKVLSEVDWAGVAKSVGDAFTTVFKAVFSVIDRIDWNKVGQVLGVILSKAMDIALMILKAAFNLGARILNWLDGINWGAVGQKAGGYFMDVASVVVGAIYKVISALPEMIMKVFKHAADFIVGALEGIKQWLMKKFPSAAGPISVIFDILKGIVKVISGAMQIAFKVISTVLGAIWSVVKGIFGVIWKIASAVGGALSTAFGAIKDAVLWIWNKIKSVGSAIGSVVGAIGGAISKVGGFFSGIGSSIAGVFSSGSKGSSSWVRDMVKKQVDLTKKIAEEAKKRKEEWVKTEHAAGRATEGYVKTVEGHIITSASSIYKYVETANGGIQKVFMDTAKMTKAVVGGEAFEYMDKMQAEIALTNKIAGKTGKTGSDEWNAAMDSAISSADAAHQEYFKKFGVRWTIMFHRNQQIADQYSIENSIMEKAESIGVGYYAAMKANQTKLSEVAGQDILRLEQLKQAGKLTQEQFEKQNDEINARMAKDMVKLGETTEILAGDFTKVFEKYAGNAEGMALFAERASYQMAAAFRANGDEIMERLPKTAQASRDAMKTAFDELGSLQEKEIRGIIAGGEYTGKALEEQVRATQKKYADFQKEYTDAQLKYNDNLIEGSETGFLEATKKIKAGQDALLGAVKAKTAEAAGEIQKSFGVSGETALESVKEIGAIKPAVFRKNMKAIQESFLGFLKVMDDKGKVLMTNTNNSFDKMWETMDKGWKDNKKLLEDFASSADRTLQAFWTSIVSKASLAATQIINISKNIGTSLNTMAKSINLMDLLASPSQISAWASSVVSALSVAIRGGGVADTLLSTSYTKALAMAGEIQKAQPDNGTATTASGSAATATLTLLASINHPKWTDKDQTIPQLLSQMNENLVDALKAMGKVAETKATSGKTPRAPKP